jgi:hypothetical protein
VSPRDITLEAGPGEDLRDTIRARFERFECTAETPWSGRREDAPNGVQHVDAREVGAQEDGWPGGDIVAMHCPSCGTRWRMELPQ